MRNYNLPTNSLQLIGLATKNVEGMQALSSTLHLTLITTGEIKADLAAFVEQDSAYNAARSAKGAASDTYSGAMRAIYDWLLGVSNVLATRFGTRWNTQWAQAGFINNTTAIPSRIEDRLGLTLALVGFFTANLTYEVTTMNLTAAAGAALRTAALDAQSAVTAATVAQNTVGATWQTAYDALVKGIRSLPSDDPRWLSFGFQLPITVTTPGKPANLLAHLDGTGQHHRAVRRARARHALPLANAPGRLAT